jgi:hypothetical protein
VANGRVYVNGKTKLTVFGLLPTIDDLAGNNLKSRSTFQLTSSYHPKRTFLGISSQM